MLARSSTASLHIRLDSCRCRCARPLVRIHRRRFTSSPVIAISSPNPKKENEDPSILLREVMRNVAQPVSIAVANLPPRLFNDPDRNSKSGQQRYHGATLTSFTSLTLYPHPLVAFSLRLPSRMADCLRDVNSPSTSTTTSRTPSDQSAITNTTISTRPKNELPPLPWPLSTLPKPDPPAWFSDLMSILPNPLTGSSSNTSISPSSSPTISCTRPSATTSTKERAKITISLLSTKNESTADSLSQSQTDHSALFSPDTDQWIYPQSYPPYLKDCVGSLQCEVVSSVPLGTICLDSSQGIVDGIDHGDGPIRTDVSAQVQSQGSELFICRVIGVEMGGENAEPLMHWRRKYVGVRE